MTTIEGLDAAVARADAAGAISDDALRAAFQTFEYRPDLSRLPKDPFSLEYRQFQDELYRQISGRDRYFAQEAERTPFDLATALRRPFPYSTASCTTVGNQLIMQGFLIRHLALPRGARILEFGPGWGNTTLHLAQMGFDVTAVDVYDGFTDLIGARAAQIGVTVTTAVSDMLDFRAREPYDAVVFFECFHHCTDHMGMLEHLRGFVADGPALFAAEPISWDMPYPWGIRLDGISVWSIRKFGWFELGFRPDYFAAALRRSGWSSRVYHSDDAPDCSVYVARQR